MTRLRECCDLQEFDGKYHDVSCDLSLSPRLIRWMRHRGCFTGGMGRFACRRAKVAATGPVRRRQGISWLGCLFWGLVWDRQPESMGLASHEMSCCETCGFWTHETTNGLCLECERADF